MDRMLAMSIGVAIASSFVTFAFTYTIAYEISYTHFCEKNRQAEELKPIDVTKYNVTENGNVVVKEELTEAKELLREVLNTWYRQISVFNGDDNEKKIREVQAKAEAFLKE